MIGPSLSRAAFAVLLLCTAGCAIFDSDNRRTLGYLDEHLAPRDPAARWALAPVALPAGLAAGSIDAVIVHPATVLDDAWGDTTELLWDRGEESRFRRVLFTPLAAIATPPVFLGDWLGRSLFSIPPRPEQSGELTESHR